MTEDPVERVVDAVLRHHYLEENYDMDSEEFEALVRRARPDIEAISSNFGPDK